MQTKALILTVLLLIITFFSFKLEIKEAKAQNLTSIDLWVNGFDNVRTGWTRIGSSPYLDVQDQPNNYINGSDFNEIGDFSFEDLPAEAISVINCTIYYYGRTEISIYNRFKLYVWNGIEWIYIGILSPGLGVWEWKSYDLSNVLDTIEKINNAKIYLLDYGYSGYWVAFDAIYLKVYYEFTPVEPQFSNLGYDNNILANYTNFSCKWTDPDGLAEWIFSYNDDGVWENTTYTISGSPITCWTNTSRRLPPKNNTLVQWRFYCMDTLGNTGVTPIQSLITNRLNYTTLETKEIFSSDIDVQTPKYWELVKEGASATGQAVFQTIYFTIYRLALWIKLDKIDTQDTYDFVEGYEFHVYDAEEGIWVIPESVFSYCGGFNPSYLIDNNTATDWEHADLNQIEKHWIIVKLDKVRYVSKARWYCSGGATSNVTSMDIYVGLQSGWAVAGNSPFLNSSDYPVNYIYTRDPNRVIGNFSFFNLTSPTIIKLHMIVNASIYAGRSVSVLMYDVEKDVEEVVGFILSTNDIWKTMRVELNRTYWSSYILLNKVFRFKSDDATSGYCKLDYVQLYAQVYTFDNMIKYMCESIILSRVNNTFPFQRLYNEEKEQWKDESIPPLHLIYGYRRLKDIRYLQFIKEAVDYLQNQNWTRFFQKYNVITNTWVGTSAGISRLLELGLFVEEHLEYKEFLQQQIDWYLKTQLKTPEYRILTSDFNGNPLTDQVYVRKTSEAIVGLTYLGYLLNNITLIDIAERIALNYTLGEKTGVPYCSIYLNGTKGEHWYCKEDINYGFFLQALEFLYYVSERETIKNRLLTVAEGSVYFHNSTQGTYQYRIDPDTGEVVWMGAVHGFGVIDEAVATAYLLFKNFTWLNQTKFDFDETGIKGILDCKFDLIIHTTYYAPYCSPKVYQTGDIYEYWNGFALRAAMILYNLNHSLVYRNEKYLNVYKKYYGATSTLHLGNLGWLAYMVCNGTHVFPDVDTGTVGLKTLFRSFIYKNVTLNDFDDVVTEFGNSLIPPLPILIKPLCIKFGVNETQRGRTANFYSKWRDKEGLDQTWFYWNATGEMLLNGTVLHSGNPLEAWANFTRTLPSSPMILHWQIITSNIDGINSTKEYFTYITFLNLTFTLYEDSSLKFSYNQWKQKSFFLSDSVLSDSEFEFLKEKLVFLSEYVNFVDFKKVGNERLIVLFVSTVEKADLKVNFEIFILEFVVQSETFKFSSTAYQWKETAYVVVEINNFETFSLNDLLKVLKELGFTLDEKAIQEFNFVQNKEKPVLIFEVQKSSSEKADWKEKFFLSTLSLMVKEVYEAARELAFILVELFERVNVLSDHIYKPLMMLTIAGQFFYELLFGTGAWLGIIIIVSIIITVTLREKLSGAIFLPICIFLGSQYLEKVAVNNDLMWGAILMFIMAIYCVGVLIDGVRRYI